MKELHWNKYNAAADLDPFPDIRYQCPACYNSFKEEYDECPNCGLVIKRTLVRDCHKCVYEVGCHGNPVGCKSYKRDAPDGGYYG